MLSGNRIVYRVLFLKFELMKTFIIISILFAFSITVVGQNYMGMSQSKIVKCIGEPDRRGDNFYVYNVLEEKGENIYYFDEKGNCNSFEIVRNISYYNEYQKMLESEFVSASKNRYVKKTKKINYLAELTLAKDTFEIKIQDIHNIPVTYINQMMQEISFE